MTELDTLYSDFMENNNEFALDINLSNCVILTPVDSDCFKLSTPTTGSIAVVKELNTLTQKTQIIVRVVISDFFTKVLKDNNEKGKILLSILKNSMLTELYKNTTFDKLDILTFKRPGGSAIFREFDGICTELRLYAVTK